MKPEKAQKIEKGIGYTLLVLGLVLIILPALMAIYIFLTGWQVPQFVPVPTGQEKEFVGASAAFSGVCMVFFIFITIVWAGSIVSSRGVAMIKDAKLKLVRKSLREVAETVKKEEENENS
jgi:ABC-type sugar transport system permease subunit